MKLQEALARAHDTVTAKRVYGDPIERDGITVIPAAAIRGAGGGGEGEDATQQSSGAGAGWATSARPVGAYVIDHGKVHWRPAIDVNRAVVELLVTAVVTLALRQRRG
jgi:uncharacterized spore protein YtfJ